ncbi:hypothetical protein QYE76_042194 [Lolium multiflorum]|uniref:Retrotransposon gag domain-containing protein n=1 Tax=Lolium multiflorum TaxID=4521 RepID=A0AAD8WWQ8_LOLMU|nr:hypothetical protein QYE76_042194 [Lolium multiflorum]
MFQEGFRTAHVSTGVMTLKRREFRNLRQNHRTVAEYIEEFSNLARYAPEDVDTDAKRKERFLDGLHDDLAVQLSIVHIPDFQTLLDKATILEGKQKQAENRKRKHSNNHNNSAPHQRTRTFHDGNGNSGQHKHGGNGHNHHGGMDISTKEEMATTIMARSVFTTTLEEYHPGKANVVADALSRKVYVNGITAGELPSDLCELFKDLRLEIVPKGYLASMEVVPTLLDRIREAQKGDDEMDEIKENMEKGKAEGFRLDEQGTLWFEKRLCVPNDPEIRKLIFQEAHDSPYSIHPGEVAYELELPEALSAVHNVFHVSQLKKCHPEMAATPLRDTIPLDEVQLESDLTYEEKPVKILDTAERFTRTKTIRFCKTAKKPENCRRSCSEDKNDQLSVPPGVVVVPSSPSFKIARTVAKNTAGTATVRRIAQTTSPPLRIIRRRSPEPSPCRVCATCNDPSGLQRFYVAGYSEDELCRFTLPSLLSQLPPRISEVLAWRASSQPSPASPICAIVRLPNCRWVCGRGGGRELLPCALAKAATARDYFGTLHITTTNWLGTDETGAEPPRIRLVAGTELLTWTLAKAVDGGHHMWTRSIAGEPVKYEDLPPEHKKRYDELKAILEADLIGAFEKTRSHGIKFKGFQPEGALDGLDLSLPSDERTRALRQEVNYAVAHSLHRHAESLVNTLERVTLNVVQEVTKHKYSPSGPALGTHQGEEGLPRQEESLEQKQGWADLEEQAWLSKYATSTSHQRSTSAAPTVDEITAIMRDQFDILPKKRMIGYSKPYPNDYDLIPLPPKYRLPDFTKFSGSEGTSSIEHVSRYLAQLGMVSASDELRVRFFSQSHRIVQDKYKRVALIETAEDEYSAGDQEVAVAEWTRGAKPVSCKWVKQPGPAKGFDFDLSKTEQIFDLLLKEKQLKLPEGHKIPTPQEMNGKPYCKWHHTFTHTTNDCKVLRGQIQMAIEQGRLLFGQFAMRVDTQPFPEVNMVDLSQCIGREPGFSFGINMAGLADRHGDDEPESSHSRGKDKKEADPRDRPQHDDRRYLTEEDVISVRYQRPLSAHLLNKYEQQYDRRR